MMYKTTIVIWSEYDPTSWTLEDLARDAASGEAHCSKSNIVPVEKPEDDPDWEWPELFGEDEDG